MLRFQHSKDGILTRIEHHDTRLLSSIYHLSDSIDHYCSRPWSSSSLGKHHPPLGFSNGSHDLCQRLEDHVRHAGSPWCIGSWLFSILRLFALHMVHSLRNGKAVFTI